jgi:predicted enzyme related to lactoylglutathione lyase
MAAANVSFVNKPVWVDLSSADPAGARDFYSRVFGWQIEVNPDPQYGGYALARVNGNDVAGIGPKQSAEAPSAWMVYVGTNDADEVARRVAEAGGQVVMPPMSVGDQGRMGVFRDPAGAFISVWQPKRMAGFQTGAANTFGWAELNARGLDRDLGFYARVFGWDPKNSASMGEGQPYTEFYLAGESIAGAMEMSPMVPQNVPSYWMAYFLVDDVDAAYELVLASGGRMMLEPQDFQGGRFAIVADPQGASFGLLKMRVA